LKYLITGLGNIGDEYINTRHNTGFLVVDALAKEAGVKFQTERYASVAELKYKGRPVILIKPTTYMNLSGKAFKYWKNKLDISIEQCLVVVDDVALEPGVLRMKARGSDGGHNGLIHIIETMETMEFPRLRVGIGNNFARGFQSDYVLGKWTKDEEKIFIQRIPLAVEMIKSFVTTGIENTMNLYNNR